MLCTILVAILIISGIAIVVIIAHIANENKSDDTKDIL
jgi:hypothetical protein